MDNTTLGIVEDTLFVPMLGRIYASKHFPSILYDKKALSLAVQLPAHITKNDRQTQYTYLASAVRSTNMDRYIKDFMFREPRGIIVQLGCGLETTFYRNDNHSALWYAVDLPHVIEYRRSLLLEHPRERYFAGDAFKEDWLLSIRKEHPTAPLLVIASGLFHYFTEQQVCALIRMLQKHDKIELLFDAVNKHGMRLLKKKHMKTVGHADAPMFFYIDSVETLASKIGGQIVVKNEEVFFLHINKLGLRLSTKLSMTISDLMGMVKIVHIQLGTNS